MITPRQASETLTIPTSTLRRWSKEFSEHLSPHEKGKHRAYTITDLDTLRKIQDLLDQGLRYADIHSRLNAIEKPSESKAIANITSELVSIIEQQQASLQALNTRLEKLETYLSEPFIKRIFTKPRKQKDQD